MPDDRRGAHRGGLSGHCHGRRAKRPHQGLNYNRSSIAAPSRRGLARVPQWPTACFGRPAAALPDFMNSIRRPVLLLCVAGLLACVAPARADDRSEAQRLLATGQDAQALALIEQALAARPRDAQWRFLGGVALARTGRANEAIAVFVALNEDFPELAEPYNNLAVLYAAQGDLDKARAALEAALRSNPSYATAQENLGDLYLRLAERAYGRALALDAGRAGLAPRIAQLKAMVPDRVAEGAAKTP